MQGLREVKAGVKVGGVFKFECRDKDGNLKWVEDIHNLVVNTGLDDFLDKYFKGSSYTAAHYVGLKGTGSMAAGDTMASHAGWSEITAYSQANRPIFTPGTVSSQSVSNSASVAVFSINGSASVYGAFLATDNTKGGSTGTLFSGVDFTSSRTVADGDTINVTYTFTSADDGA